MNFIATHIYRNPDKFKKIHLFYLYGQINSTMTYKVYKALKKFDHKKSKCLALVINSPGGSLAQSYIIQERFNQIKSKYHLPLYTFVEDHALSAAMNLLLMGDKIYCHRTSLVGGLSASIDSIKIKDLLKSYHIDIKNYGTKEYSINSNNSQSLTQFVNPFADFTETNEIQESVKSLFNKNQELVNKQCRNPVDLNEIYLGKDISNKLFDGEDSYINVFDKMHPGMKIENLTKKTQNEKIIEFCQNILFESKLILN